MRKLKLIKVNVSLIVIFLSFNAYSQFGAIEMKNGELFEIVDDKFSIEGDQLRYYKEKVESGGFSLFGIISKKQKQKYIDKTNVVNINEINIIHLNGELLVGNKFIADFIGVKYIKINRRYEEFYVIRDGKCKLLVKPESGNAVYSYYVQEGNEDPFILHKAGVGIGPKLGNRSEKYFADCGPAMDYIKNDLNKSTLPNLIDIYNANCAK